VDGAPAALAALGDAAAAGDPFRLVLSDAMMPDIDGFAFARAVKADSRLSGATLIMLTSAGLPEGRARADEAGFAAYLSKPVKQSELLDAIVTVCGPRTVSELPAALGARRPSSSRAPQRPLRILVAEDNATNQKLIVTLLELQQHTVVVAPNGRDAVRLAEDQRFDLILMDVQMPEMSGLEATAAIRQREEASGAHVPIVAMTAHAMAGDRERCLAAGMDGYVSKPLRPEELFGAIDDLFASGPFADAVPGAGPAPVDHALDGTALLAGFSGNKKLLGEVIDVFLADSPNLMLAIRQAVAQHDGKALAASAHALKGSIGLFVQQDAYQTARGLERAAAGGDLTGAQEACATLEREMEVLREQLGDLRREL
jgi:CheY-like chemotaxis protein